MPLPLISARPPSALNSCHRDVGGARRRRRPGRDVEQPVGADYRDADHTAARATAPSTAWAPSRSSSTRKSLPRPWCLVRRMCLPVCPSRRLHQRRFARARAAPRTGRTTALQATRSGDHAGTRPVGAGRTAGCGGRRGPPPRRARGRRPGARPAPCTRAPAPRSATVRPDGRAEPCTSSRKPGGELALVALGDAGGDDLRRKGDAHEAERRRRVRLETGAERRERAAAADRDLRAPARCAGGSMRSSASRRPDRARAVGRAARRWVRRRASRRASGILARDREAVDDGAQVQTGAADEDGAMARGPRCPRRRRRTPAGTERR